MAQLGLEDRLAICSTHRILPSRGEKSIKGRWKD